MEGDKGDLVLIETYLVDVGKIVGKKHGHVVDRSVILFQLRPHRVGDAHLVSTPLIGIIHMQDKLHDKIIVKFRDAVPLGHQG